MKYYRSLLISITYAVLSGFIPAQQDTCVSTVNVITDKDSSLIYINKKPVDYGKTSLKLPVGLYVIEARESEKGWGGSHFIDTLRLTECGIEKELRFEFKDRTLLTTSPSDVSVIYKDSLLGKTPLYVLRDYGSLLLRKKDYAEASIDLNRYKAGETIALEYQGGEKKISFMKTPVFKYLIVGAAVLGATAAYFKLEADKNYDKYLETKDGNYLDKTDSYDLISGVSMGALQINLGVLAYLLLSD